ncbi:MAG: glutamine synthetase adenylyltransferase [Microbacterium sp.]|nr:glutamine synthetase adenylyltransferase [Microbacterium sp.]
MSRTATPRRLRPAVIAWLALGALTAVLIALAASVAVGGFVAQKELRAAVPLVSKMQSQFGSDDRTALASSITELQGHASRARGAADTWMWQLAEQAPFVGPTLHAVRESTVAVDELAQGALPALANVDPALLRPKDGAFDVAAILQLSGPLSEASSAADRAAGAVRDVDVADTPGVLQGPLGQLTGVVRGLQPALSRAVELMPVLPSLMGAEGTKNYLLLVQNNAEARGAGGIPASVVLLKVENGKMEIAQQATSRDFKNTRKESILPLDPEVVKLYDDKIGRYSQDITSTPDFAMSADFARAYWAESFGTPVDGVMSIDPVTLSYLLDATGPITLATGDQLTSSDAVKILLSDVYARYPDNADQDAFFASAAVEVFDAVSSGDFAPVSFATALVRAVDEHRVYFYSFDDTTRAAFADSRLLGPLPSTDGDQQTTLGVFINDLTEAKLSYYTWMSADVSVNRCSAVPTYTTTVTFTNALDRATSDGLVRYVDGGKHFPKGTIGTDMQFYGPSGATFVKASFDGVDVPVTTGEHLGRPVARLFSTNDPQTTHSLSVTFEGSPDNSDDVSLVHTPMVNPVPSHITEVSCG